MGTKEAHLTSTVLIVDTDTRVVGALAAELAQAGFDPSGVNSYRDAGRRLEASSPDVVVVSVELGAYNGLQLAMHCARTHPATRVIVVGPASSALANDACALGASAYMPRPLTTGALIDRVKSLAPVDTGHAPVTSAALLRTMSEVHATA